MDPIIVPIVTEIQRRNTLKHTLCVWRAARQIGQLERDKAMLVRQKFWQAASKHRNRMETEGPDANDPLNSWSPDEEFSSGRLSVVLPAAGPKIAFQAMRTCQKHQRKSSVEGTASVFDTISNELWKDAFFSSFSHGLG